MEILKIAIEELNQEQRTELKKILTEDILNRYDNEQYWDPQIVENFLQEQQNKAK